MSQIMRELRERRARLAGELQAVLEAPTRFNRNLSAAESAQFNGIESQIKEIDVRLAELEDQEMRDAQAGAVVRRYGIFDQSSRGVSRDYDRESPYFPNSPNSFFRDLYLSRMKNDRAAFDRLERNNRIRVDHAARENRALSTSNGAGGEWVPPLWLEERYIEYARPGRITADLCTRGDIPPGTDSINIPKVNTGTAVAVQATQNTGVQQTDLTTTSVQSPVITIAGGQTVSLQLVEQSPLNMDEVILRDLSADYARYLNLQVLSGSGSGGQVTGLLTLGGTQAVAWTQTTPALTGAGGLYSKLANAIELIQTARYMPATAIVMHPRRWAWVVSQSDSQNRPVVVPEAGGPMNAAGVQVSAAAQGYVGRMLGLPVYIDALLPTNIGAGTNQDEIVVAKMDDLYLWESHIRAEAFQQTYAQNMSVFIRLYNYVSFQPARFPASIATINGTGLVAPTF